MLEVVREEGETIDHLIRRYNDRLKRLNFFKTVKAGAFYSRKINKRQRKISALYKDRKRKKMDYLKLIGKLDDPMLDSNYYAGLRVKFNASRKSD